MEVATSDAATGDPPPPVVCSGISHRKRRKVFLELGEDALDDISVMYLFNIIIVNLNRSPQFEDLGVIFDLKLTSYLTPTIFCFAFKIVSK